MNATASSCTPIIRVPQEGRKTVAAFFLLFAAAIGFKRMSHAFCRGFTEKSGLKNCIKSDRALREQLGEKQIDSMIEDSFPASDPPSTY